MKEVYNNILRLIFINEDKFKSFFLQMEGKQNLDYFQQANGIFILNLKPK